MKLNEIQKTELKRQVWNNRNCAFMVDSLNNEVINLDFQTIDNNLYAILDRHYININSNYKSDKRVYSDYLTKQVLQGKKIQRWF